MKRIREASTSARPRALRASSSPAAGGGETVLLMTTQRSFGWAGLGAALDHPVHPGLPETAYLKAMTLQLD